MRRVPRPLIGERVVSSPKGAGKAGCTHCKIMNVDPYLKTKTKVNSNVRSEAIKLPEENIGVSSLTLVLAMTVLDLTPKAKPVKAKINKGLTERAN